MKTLLAALALTLGAWTQEIEPNDRVPAQLVGLSEMRLHGALHSDSDRDRYWAWLGFPFPYLSEWYGPITVTGDHDKWIALDFIQTTYWGERQYLGGKGGFGSVTFTPVFIHNPDHIPTLQMIVSGEAQRYEVTAPK